MKLREPFKYLIEDLIEKKYWVKKIFGLNYVLFWSLMIEMQTNPPFLSWKSVLKLLLNYIFLVFCENCSQNLF